MVAGMRSSLLAGGTDVTEAIVNGSLTLSSNTDHLLDRRFDTDRMIDMLEQALYQALHDGYDGLWATGDMSREFGPEHDFSRLLEYEWRLEEFLQAQPALSGVCQYHADTLPPDVLRQGVLTHRSFYVNETLSRVNPHYVEREAFISRTFDNSTLDETINDLYQS
jgi:DcmR-like sensory protein